MENKSNVLLTDAEYLARFRTSWVIDGEGDFNKVSYHSIGQITDTNLT